MVEELGVSILQMMENAGRSLAALAIERWAPKRVTVLAGSRGNGGGGMAAGRHLANRGIAVVVTTSRPSDRLDGAAAAQMRSLQAIGVPNMADPPPADLVIDALVGYSLMGDLHGRAAELVEWANGHGPILALDVPSGLEPTTGRIGIPCVKAAATMTLALPKQGLTRSEGVVGDLYLADISVPPDTYRRMGIDLEDPFGGRWVVAVDTE